jgi:small subunit ribosomal protein S1
MTSCIHNVDSGIAIIRHSRERFYVGQWLKVVYTGYNHGRYGVSHKELLGTWAENAELFSHGEVVRGVIRGFRGDSAFVELAPFNGYGRLCRGLGCGN